MERVYFRGLNAIRAWAAIFVVWWHLEEFKGHFLVTDNSEESWFFLARYGMAGNDAVLVFFVLSGFLITYLLLKEYKTDGQIDIRKFYLRRTLRIWPVYYLTVLLGFFLVPLVVKLTNFDGFYVSTSNDFFEKFSLFMLFLPNVAHALRFFPVTLMHLWTIGVEEAFYVFWPQLVQRFRQHLLLIIAVVLVYRVVLMTMIDVLVPPNADFRLQGFDLFLIILSKYPFEGMAIGALGAYLLFHGKDGILKLIFHPFTKWLTLLLLILNIAFFRLTPMSVYFHNFSQIVYSCLYMSFILNVVHDKTFLPHFDAPIYDFLGKLSYGIYMYHMLVIYFTLIAFNLIGWGDNSFLYNSVLYTVVTGLTIAAAYVSYRWLEMPFLNLKKKFQTIESVTTQGEAEKEQKPA